MTTVLRAWLVPVAWVGTVGTTVLPAALAATPPVSTSQLNGIDPASRIGANLGAVRYCIRNYGTEEIIRTRFKALEQLASEALQNLTGNNRQRAEQQRVLVEGSGLFDGKPLTLTQCEAVRKGFLDHYR